MTGRLVLVTSSFPIRDDGSEAAGSFVADLARQLAGSIDVSVVAPGAATAHERWDDHIDVFRYAAPSQPLSTLKPWRPRDARWVVRVWRGGLGATRAAVTEGAVGVVAFWGLPCGEWVRRAARGQGIAYSVWLLGSDVWSLGRLPVARGMLRRVIRQASTAYADGYRLAQDAERIAGVPVAFLPSTRQLSAAIPPAPRSAPPYRLLFLGRWHPNKGVDVLLDALALLDDDNWRRVGSIEIQGGGPMKDLVHERVAALRAARRPVEVGRFLGKSEAEAAIARADWVLIPSRVESIPVVFSDAMKLGRPVVATPVGDLDRLVSESGAGLVAEGATARDYCRALQRALASAAFAMSTRTAPVAQQFDLSRIAARVLADATRSSEGQPA